MSYKSPWHHPTSIFFSLLSTTATSSPLPSPPPQPPPPPSALKPSMTIIIGILTTIFSITFLLLLYAKHCRRTHNPYPLAVRAAERINSGIDRTIIESLPVFRFGSLSGQKDGLECAVCLSRFDPNEMLRLLPKCKHAFHVECVDTWLDAHSTCPLCRYRVDPEDIFLIIGDQESLRDIDNTSREVDDKLVQEREIAPKRVSGRHSSAGENVTGIKISVDSTPILPVTGSRRSLDGWNLKKKVSKKSSAEARRKDGMLLVAADEERRRRRKSFEKRFEHRIVVGTGGGTDSNKNNRWSDVQPSDLLYLRSEMMILKKSRPLVLHEEGNNGLWQNGRSVINSRSVSEMSGLSRFGSNEVGVLSRWLARLSEPKSGRNSSSSNV
ncbi:RING-H2 finger protein ATL43-like [Rutidosis leptorrhynchoides]|uniref:RING-H2 finger protein ATL43-like n=1 Tax=Rutidosis leptorrhynchoides TaxID=125765 RepID=UPI003A999C64